MAPESAGGSGARGLGGRGKTGTVTIINYKPFTFHLSPFTHHPTLRGTFRIYTLPLHLLDLSPRQRYPIKSIQVG